MSAHATDVVCEDGDEVRKVQCLGHIMLYNPHHHHVTAHAIEHFCKQGCGCVVGDVKYLSLIHI